ncbi:hypothetical protein C5167_028964, partial [Papaver somniferum]
MRQHVVNRRALKRSAASCEPKRCASKRCEPEHCETKRCALKRNEANRCEPTAGWRWRGLHINLAAPLTYCRAFVAKPDVQPEHSHNRPARCAASNTAVATQPDVQLDHSQNCEPKRCALKRYEATCCEPKRRALKRSAASCEPKCCASKCSEPEHCETKRCALKRNEANRCEPTAGWCWRGLHINLAAPFEPKCWERKCSGSEDCEPKNFANSCLAYPTSDISKWRVIQKNTKLSRLLNTKTFSTRR